jgi:cell cycle checkpoint control protein RAD9A
VVKTYKLTYEDVEILHAVFNRDTATARWRLGSSLLKEYMEHFSAKAEKLAISSAASEGRATFTSFTEKLVDGKDTLKQPLHTNVSLDIGNFEEFSVDDGVRVGVSLKDFTAVAWFAAILETMVEARYSVPGRAMQVAYAKDGLEAVYTLMTAQDNRISQSLGGPGSQMGRVVAVQRREPVETREETPRREMMERQESGRPPTERLESVRPSGRESTAGTIHQPTPRRETPASLAPQQNFSYRPTQQLPPMPPTPPPPPQTAPLFLYREDEDEMDDSDREHNLFGEMDQERGSFTLGWDTTYAGNAEKGEKTVNKKKRGRNTVEDEDDDSDGDFVMPTQQPRVSLRS